MVKSDPSKLLTDTALIGVMNVVAIFMAQKLYPNNFLIQAFISGSILHLSMKIIEFPAIQ